MDLAGKKIHFMGVGGIGVSALAEMALHRGAVVSGCDRSHGKVTAKLESRGIPVCIGHDPLHVRDIDALVYTSAVSPGDPERLAAGDRQVKRGRFLADFIDAAEGWGVSGTHGKTTTSWMLAHILIQAGKDPSVFVGGIVPDLPEGNYRIGLGPFVAELDESDGSFLLPKLRVAIITNIESDHLSHYGNDEALFGAFESFAAGVADAGLLVAGTDNAVAANIYSSHSGRKLSFGFTDSADLRVMSCITEKGVSRFSVSLRNRDLGEFALPMPGLHNVANALAAMGAALEMGGGVEVVRKALAEVRGVERRLERLGALGDTVLYSDYAHHPTEVAASIAALRTSHDGPVLVVFQPHLFSRTRDYAEDFGAALAGADAALLVEIYPAREEPIPGINSQLLTDAVHRRNGIVFGPVTKERVSEEVRQRYKNYEAIVMMGAGDIDAIARDLAKR